MIRVAIVGVGNCASSLVQGVQFYINTPTASGLIHPIINGLLPSDIEFVAAFDVDRSKIGRPLAEAIFRGQNNTLRVVDSISIAQATVSGAPVIDGIGEKYRDRIQVSTIEETKVDKILESASPDVLINYLPVGSDKATSFWAEKCLKHEICFLNAIPSFLVSDPDWEMRFRKARIPCAGDDIKSQIGATIIHRALAHLFASRGGAIQNTYQLNFGGNMDFFNMLEQGRLSSKKKSKAMSVQYALPERSRGADIHITPSGYIKYLGDQKVAYINVSGNAFSGAPIEIECKMKVWDSPNSAGVVIDVIRFLHNSRTRRESGSIDVCPFYFKHPLENLPDHIAEKIVTMRASGEKGEELRD
jgi:myo-inositol-1-phosphate synthase